MHILDEELYQAGMAVASCPTAPYHEAHVRACLQGWLRDLPNVTTHLDEFGNLHAHYEHKPGKRQPFRVVAHMDHPAFIVHRKGGKEELHFAGGVEEKYFSRNRITFYNEKTRQALGWAVVESCTVTDSVKRVAIDRPIPAAATFAMWDLPEARCTSQLFLSPACDDLVQVATVLAVFQRLALGGAKANFHALFTRAEEVGFAGALAALKAEKAVAVMPTVSLEISQARGFAKVDEGPVLRVGDKSSVFDSRVTHWLECAFRDLKEAKPATVYQRLLMGGGTCEASVFQHAGLPTGALCLALNSYHNMAPGDSIRPESISLRDWQGLFDFLFFLATEAKSLDATNAALTARFAKLEEKALAALKAKPI